jgi:shikimate dehydrogenase
MKYAGLIGNPVDQSKSPLLHTLISQELNDEFKYEKVNVNPSDIKNTIQDFIEMGWVGFNVTIPYKLDILNYLHEISNEAKLIGAVNTVKINNGLLTGYNTDAGGFGRDFFSKIGDTLKGKTIIVFGAGGSAKAVISQAVIEGAKCINIYNRTIKKAQDLSLVVNESFNTDIVKVVCAVDLQDCIKNADVLINCTNVGMFPNINESIIPHGLKINKYTIVYDLIYNPTSTELLQIATKAGCVVVNGIGMLFYQGLSAYEIWFEKKIDESTTNKIYHKFTKIALKGSNDD